MCDSDRFLIKKSEIGFSALYFLKLSTMTIMMRKHDISQALYNLRMSTNKYDFMDQDCLNILFENKVKLLPVKYNLFYNFFCRTRRIILWNTSTNVLERIIHLSII